MQQGLVRIQPTYENGRTLFRLPTKVKGFSGVDFSGVPSGVSLLLVAFYLGSVNRQVIVRIKMSGPFESGTWVDKITQSQLFHFHLVW